LLASLNHFLSDEWDKARAQKRGGGKVISLDFQSAETRLGEIPVENFTPEKAFEHRWAITLLEQVYQRLGEEYRAEGKGTLFDALRTALAGSSDAAPYAELAKQLGLTEGAVKVAVHRCASVTARCCATPLPTPSPARTRWRMNCAICSGHWRGDFCGEDGE